MTAVSRVTRSTTRKAIAEAQTKLSASSARLTSKQTAGPLEDEERRPRKKRSKARVGASSQDDGQSLKTASQDPTRPFVLSEAQAHLAALDDRFSLLFGRLPCGPFDNLSKSSIDQVAEPFRNLCCSILGQQVSCLAARSITYKFIKLYSCARQITVQNRLGCMGQGRGWVGGPNLQMMIFLEVSDCAGLSLAPREAGSSCRNSGSAYNSPVTISHHTPVTISHHT
ncbi:hypothetical protein PGTUg99_012219 [Puccinia graminis f. sp. tritici]|uniref:Uncharacterized protein n=1 Tax=Puccinia graminis f. sp. tritici TaxID=56615 RepID=A0A5B0QK98_PUCGR|nr:hypothetical protein PGTUg99_012219 [Puccinia graminis f. sp. tritici]